MSKIFNNALLEAKERESAVSPVVGVMLMLVVTIIIAATVSAFAGGLVGTADKAPQAAFDVKIASTYQSMYDYTARTMVITHLGGDPIDTAKMKIITTWTNRTTNEVYYRETAALPRDSENPYEYASGKFVELNMLDANVNTSYKYQEPYFVIPNVWPSSNPDIWYGNFILHPGDVMKAQSSLQLEYNANGYPEHSTIKESLLLTEKDVVNVKFVYVPTGTIIYDKDIYVTEGSI